MRCRTRTQHLKLNPSTWHRFSHVSTCAYSLVHDPSCRVQYLVHLESDGKKLAVEIEEDVHGDENDTDNSPRRWKGRFSAKYVEDITLKTGNFKRFDVFVEMLSSSFAHESDSVFIDLLTYSDLEMLRQRKGKENSLGSNSSGATAIAKAKATGKRYLILTYSSEYDRVHYPLPLAMDEEPTVESLRRTISRLRAKMEKDRSGVDMHGSSSMPSTGGESARLLRAENSSLQRRLLQAQELYRTAVKESSGSSTEEMAVLRRVAAEAEEELDDVRKEYGNELSRLRERLSEAEARVGDGVRTRRDAPPASSGFSNAAAELDAAAKELRGLRRSLRDTQLALREERSAAKRMAGKFRREQKESTAENKRLRDALRKMREKLSQAKTEARLARKKAEMATKSNSRSYRSGRGTFGSSGRGFSSLSRSRERGRARTRSRSRDASPLNSARSARSTSSARSTRSNISTRSTASSTRRSRRSTRSTSASAKSRPKARPRSAGARMSGSSGRGIARFDPTVSGRCSEAARIPLLFPSVSISPLPHCIRLPKAYVMERQRRKQMLAEARAKRLLNDSIGSTSSRFSNSSSVRSSSRRSTSRASSRKREMPSSGRGRRGRNSSLERKRAPMRSQSADRSVSRRRGTASRGTNKLASSWDSPSPPPYSGSLSSRGSSNSRRSGGSSRSPRSKQGRSRVGVERRETSYDRPWSDKRRKGKARPQTAVAAKRESRNAWSAVPEANARMSRQVRNHGGVHRAQAEAEDNAEREAEADNDVLVVDGGDGGQTIRHYDSDLYKSEAGAAPMHQSSTRTTPAKEDGDVGAQPGDTVIKARQRALPSSESTRPGDVAAVPAAEPTLSERSGRGASSTTAVAAVPSPSPGAGMDSSFDASAELMNIDERMKELQNFLKEAKEGKLTK